MKYIQTFEDFTNEIAKNINEAVSMTDEQMMHIAKTITHSLPNHTSTKNGRFTRKQIMAAFKYVPYSKYFSKEQKNKIADLAQQILIDDDAFLDEHHDQHWPQDLLNLNLHDFLNKIKEIDPSAYYDIEQIINRNKSILFKEKQQQIDESTVTAISNKLDKTIKEMKRLVQLWQKETDTEAKEKIKDKLKELTQIKKELESELNDAVSELDKDIELDSNYE